MPVSKLRLEQNHTYLVTERIVDSLLKKNILHKVRYEKNVDRVLFWHKNKMKWVRQPATIEIYSPLSVDEIRKLQEFIFEQVSGL